MLIEQVDKTLTSSYDIRDHKTRLVLDWLHAFRFSSLELLAWRLRSTKARSQRIFRSLFKANFIQYFLTDYTYAKRFVMLTPAGAKFLQHSARRDVSAAVTQTYRLTRNQNTLHDLALQEAAIRRLSNHKELLAGRHITIPEPFHRPDMLMLSLKDNWLAYDYERSRKNIEDVYRSLLAHTRALRKQHYHLAVFLFDRESDLAYYQKLFDAKEWPRHDLKKKRSAPRTIDKPPPFLPDETKGLRKCFRFLYEGA